MMGLRKNIATPVRCDFCHKRTNYPYYCTINGIGYNFCGGAHAMAAEKNFKDKLNQGITPTSNEPLIEDNPENEETE